MFIAIGIICSLAFPETGHEEEKCKNYKLKKEIEKLEKYNLNTAESRGLDFNVFCRHSFNK